jgi:hypothetical protein
MSPLFKKLNLGKQIQVCVLNAPASFEPELAILKDVVIKRSVGNPTAFALAFAITQAELDDVSGKLVKAAGDDAMLWIAYPKGSSKKYRCEFNRDSGWSVLAAAGYEPVRMVAIDADWSALRFRQARHIGSMSRDPSRALSEAGKAKARKK